MKSKIEPVYITINEAVDRWRTGRTKLYEFIKLDAFRTVKVGSRTLVDVRSGDEFFSGLPSAASQNRGRTR